MVNQFWTLLGSVNGQGYSEFSVFPRNEQAGGGISPDRYQNWFWSCSNEDSMNLKNRQINHCNEITSQERPILYESLVWQKWGKEEHYMELEKRYPYGKK